MGSDWGAFKSMSPEASARHFQFVHSPNRSSQSTIISSSSRTASAPAPAARRIRAGRTRRSGSARPLPFGFWAVVVAVCDDAAGDGAASEGHRGVSGDETEGGEAKLTNTGAGICAGGAGVDAAAGGGWAGDTG